MDLDSDQGYDRVARARRKLREQPGPAAVRAYVSRVPIRRVRTLLDDFRGLDFLPSIRPQEVGLDGRRVRGSTPSGNRYLAEVLRALSISADDSILDVGCGKGSAMRTMLKFPFARIDGIELSERIAAIAARNFRRLKVERARVLVGDASCFSGYDAYDYVYLYNPFSNRVMSRVIDALIESVHRRERRLTVIYNNPICHDVVIRRGVFSRVAIHPSEWGSGIAVYSNRARANTF